MVYGASDHNIEKREIVIAPKCIVSNRVNTQTPQSKADSAAVRSTYDCKSIFNWGCAHVTGRKEDHNNGSEGSGHWLT